MKRSVVKVYDETTKDCIIVAAGLIANCAGTYNMKSEKGNVVDKVPQWYMADINERKRVIRKSLAKTKIKFVSTV